MKTDSHFKLNKQSKRIMSTIDDKKERNIYKRMAADAQVTFEKTGYHIFKGHEKE